MAKTANFCGTGRRKKSVDRVYLRPGKGDITIIRETLMIILDLRH